MKDQDEDEIAPDDKSKNVFRKSADKITKSGKGAIQSGIDKGKEITKKIGDVATDTLTEIDSKVKVAKDEIQHSITKVAVEGAKMTKSSPFSSESKSDNFATKLESQIFSWYGYFWSIIVFGLVILISFAISARDGRFTLLPIILLIAFPLYILWIVYNAVPEIKIGSWTILSRETISIRKQLSFGKAVARTFSREMIKNSPEGAAIIGVIILILLYVIIAPFF
jgi:gas vesicle protein